jgi:hypothetical protein
MEKLREISTGFAGKTEKSATYSCCSGNVHQPKGLDTSNSKTVYQCPMKCEGDKTYDNPGICPVCNMRLMPVT